MVLTECTFCTDCESLEWSGFESTFVNMELVLSNVGFVHEWKSNKKKINTATLKL